MPPRSMLSLRALALATLLALALLLFCSTGALARPPRHGGRRNEELRQQDDGRSLAAADAAAPPGAAFPSAAAAPSPAPTLALLLAPAPAPGSKGVASLQEVKKAAFSAPSPSASAAAISPADAGNDDEEEEEEASSDDSDSDAAPDQEAAGPDADEPESDEENNKASRAEKVASAYSATSADAAPHAAAPGEPKKVKFLARGANKEIDQSQVDPSSLSDKKGSFVFYGRYCGPGWTDKQNRPGIDAVDEACHAHDTCYGKAQEDNPPSHKVRRAAAECSCDKALVSALKDFKKNKTEQVKATKAAKRAANDMIELFDLKCPISVAGAVLRPPSPESLPGGKW